MNPEHMAQLQRQMVQNQQELQDYLKDLDSWTGDIKQKDETLKKGEIDKKEVSRNKLVIVPLVFPAW